MKFCQAGGMTSNIFEIYPVAQFVLGTEIAQQLEQNLYGNKRLGLGPGTRGGLGQIQASGTND